MTCNNDCNTDCNCENAVASPNILYDTDDCGTCGGLNTTWTMENFYRASIRTKITATQLPPFDIDVNKLPYSPKGLMTLSPNTDREEVVEYEYTNGQANSPGTLTILKRGIHPGALNLVVDGQGGNSVTMTITGVDMEVAPEYNNCDFMFEHLTNSEVQRDITAQDFNIFSRYTCCIPATKESLGIVALTVPPENPDFPIAVGANDFATALNTGIVRVEDIATQEVTCNGGEISVIVAPGNVPISVLAANQRAFRDVYGTVRLSQSNTDSVALSALDYAGNLNAGIVKFKPVNTNPTCSDQAEDDDETCPTEIGLAVRANDLANTTEYGLVRLSKELDSTLQCPIVVTKHDYASESNVGIVLVQDDNCVTNGIVTVPSMCTYSDNNVLGLTYQTVDTDDCEIINTDSPTVETPIATSTNDKRNFHQVGIYERDFTVENGVKGRGLLIDGTNINDIVDEIPFNGGGYPGEGFVLTNTGANAITPKPIDQGEFYCYESMVPDDLSDDFSRFTITQGGAYQISCNLTVVNTKTQLEIAGLGNSSTVTYSIRVKTDSGIYPSGTLPISDIQQIMTTQGDPAYNAIDPLYGEPVRACTIDDHGVVFLNAGDEIWLSISTDQPDCYLTTASLSIFCIQPNV